MFRSSMTSSSGSSLFTSLSMLLILKIIKIFKKYIVVMWQHKNLHFGQGMPENLQTLASTGNDALWHCPMSVPCFK